MADADGQLVAHSPREGGIGEGMGMHKTKDGRRIMWLAHESAPKNFTGLELRAQGGQSFEGDAANEDGFEVRRMKMAFEGHAFSPDTKYKFQWASNRNGGNLVLDSGGSIGSLSSGYAANEAEDLGAARRPAAMPPGVKQPASVLQPKIADGTFVIKNSSEAVALQDKATLTRDEMAKIIGQVTTDWKFDVAKNLAEANLTAAPAADKGDVFILAPNDGTARSIADAFAIILGAFPRPRFRRSCVVSTSCSAASHPDQG